MLHLLTIWIKNKLWGVRLKLAYADMWLKTKHLWPFLLFSVGLGLGLVGLVLFVLWQLLWIAWWDADAVKGMLANVITVETFTVILAFLAILYTRYLLKRASYEFVINRYQHSFDETLELISRPDTDSKHYAQFLVRLTDKTDLRRLKDIPPMLGKVVQEPTDDSILRRAANKIYFASARLAIPADAVPNESWLQKTTAMIPQILRNKGDWDGADLSRLHLSAASIDGANLAGARLSYAKFSNMRCEGLNGNQANLSHAFIQYSDMSWASLRSAKMQGVRMLQTNFYGANLHAANLNDAVFTNCNLNGANLRFAYLNGAKFHLCRMRQANFDSANLSEAKLIQANLKGCSFKNANLRYADLRYARLEYADLTGADLTGANLEGANLSWTKLKGTIIDEANFSRAIFMPPEKENKPILPRNFKTHLKSGNFRLAVIDCEKYKITMNTNPFQSCIFKWTSLESPAAPKKQCPHAEKN